MALLDILGWEFAATGDKAMPFCECFDALGARYVLTRIGQGTLELGNKAGRVEKLCSLLDVVASERKLSNHQASELQGLLNFASGFYLTKVLKPFVSEFARVAKGTSGDHELLRLCNFVKVLLRDLPPRSYTMSKHDSPVLIFTDAAFENGVGSAGYILVDRMTATRSCGEIHIPQTLMNHWLELAGSQIISQLELYALLAIRYHHRKLWVDRQLICWIDNEASSPAPTMRALTRVLHMLCLWHPAQTWYERVCSFSNPSDEPSRGHALEAARRLGMKHEPMLVTEESLTSWIISMNNDPYDLAHLDRGK